MQLVVSRRKRKRKKGSWIRRRIGGTRRRKRDESERESSLTWTTWPGLNNRADRAFEIPSAPVNTLLRVRTRARRVEASSQHKTRMDEPQTRMMARDEIYGCAKTSFLAVNEINLRTRLVAKNHAKRLCR